ncbi:MAG: nucleoside monophosphate kinase, partial [Bryobacteraceae bacterium]|nr:nucleoside monophosphate kinase [Bryobacteraceae bacterium]
TPLAQALAPAIASGELLDDASMNDLFHARLLQADAGRGFILDGYPVSAGQAGTLDAFLKEQNFPAPTVLFIDVSEDVLKARMQKRRRADDQPANIDRRLREYREQGALLTTWYGEERLLRVDGLGTPQVVSARISRKIEEAGLRRGFATRPKELQRRPAVTP